MAINLGTDTLANNPGGEYKVLEHILMYGGKSPGTRPLLSDTGSPRWRWEYAAQAKEDDMPVRELLLEFTSKAITRQDVSDLGPFDNWNSMCLNFGSYPRALEVHIPLLYVVELREKWHWNEDDDSLLSSTSLNLYLA